MNAKMEDYARELKYAQNFLNNHKEDINLKAFLKKMKKMNCIHSQKWSMIFDYMYEHYHDECMNSTITTGLSYLVE